MASFPYGEFDDLHDAAVLGLLRRGGEHSHRPRRRNGTLSSRDGFVNS
jgi:hypothetical protein